MPIILNGQTNDITIDGVSVATDNEVSSAVSAGTSGKQDALVSGTNIKTINSNSILGSGDIVVSSADATSSAKGIDYKGLLAEYIVSGSAVTSIDFSGLDINTHKSYRVEIELVNATTSNVIVSCFVNGDTVQTNYYNQFLEATSTTVASSRANNCSVFECASSARTVGDAFICKVSGFFYCHSRVSYHQASLIETIFRHTAKIAAVPNITQLTFTASVASSIGVGSKIRIYRGDV